MEKETMMTTTETNDCVKYPIKKNQATRLKLDIKMK